mgnify:CR=1 FL=1
MDGWKQCKQELMAITRINNYIKEWINEWMNEWMNGWMSKDTVE